MDPDLSAWFAGKTFSTDWTSRFFSVWASLLAPRRDEALNVLEIGSWEGRSAIFFLQYLSKCQLTCIDTFSGSPEHALRHKWSDQLPYVEERFDANLAEFSGRVEKIKSPSFRALARLVAEERRFDLVYIDGSHHSADVQADAVFSWPMVRDGGIVIFDDYEWTFFPDEIDHPKPGINAFLSVHAGQYRELYRGYQLIVQKIERSRVLPQRTPALQEAGQTLDMAENGVEFVLIAEAGIHEAQARLPLQEHPPSTATKRASSRQPGRKAILVLGMHRSGTSALAGVINALGAAGPKHLLSANYANPRGYWESSPLNLASDDLLASAASRWHDWLQVDPQWMQSHAAERHRHKIKAILVSEFGDEPLFFIKDPRICRFVPFISSILAEMDVDAVALLPVRNPLEVAYSLKRRDRLPLPTSLLLWLRHVLEAEYHSRHMPRYFLRYEELLTDWRHHLDRAANKTGIVWPARSDQSGVEIEQFLTTDLYHERASIEDIQNHPDVTPLIRTTYDILCAMAAAGDSRDLRDQLDLVRTKFDESCELLGMAVAAQELAAEQLRDELATRIADRDAAASERHDLTLERDALIGDRDRLLADRDALLASNSWRLTAPLRWIRGPSRRRR